MLLYIIYTLCTEEAPKIDDTIFKELNDEIIAFVDNLLSKNPQNTDIYVFNQILETPEYRVVDTGLLVVKVLVPVEVVEKFRKIKERFDSVLEKHSLLDKKSKEPPVLRTYEETPNAPKLLCVYEAFTVSTTRIREKNIPAVRSA